MRSRSFYIFSLAFLLFLFGFPVVNIQAQTASTQGLQIIKLKQHTGTVEEFLKALQQQNSIPFSYSNEALPLQKKIKLTGREQTLDDVLHTLFKGTTITWLYRPDQILLFDKKPEPVTAAKTTKNAVRYTISGYVRESGSGEPLIGVTVFAREFNAGITTNNYGFYSLTLPAGRVSIVFSYVGFQPKEEVIQLDKDVPLSLNLDSENKLQEVEIVAETKPRSTQNTQTSQMQVPVEQVKDIPALLGEKDVLKVVQLMPGIQKGNEGSSGLYVRGGGPDQNLIILDDATVYNSSHLFGLFSLFNGDALKSIEVTKGGFPARYGGRLSSVLEMNLKEGNKQKIHGEGGVGLIASRLLLEGPIKKEKASFLVSARRTYLDALTYSFMPDNFKVGYYFFDSNVKFNYDFGRKDKVYVSGYFGRDKFYLRTKDNQLQSKTDLFWGNATTTARWNHLINDQLFVNTSLIYSQYRFVVAENAQQKEQHFSLHYLSGIRDVSLKTDLDFYPTPEHYIKFGGISTYHYFTPNALRTTDSGSGFSEDNSQRFYSLESAVYAEDFFSPAPKLLLNTGLRLSHFYTGGQQYFNPEPRVSAAYQFTRNSALKASFATMNQYVLLLSSTGTGLPIDLWLPATKRVPPQRSHQVALGMAQDLFTRKVTLEMEGYYKKSQKIIAYSENANFITISDPNSTENGPDWENNVVSGQGWSYGLEVLLQKKTGRFTGWVGYTLSRTQQQFDSLNGGKRFNARYDRRHDLSVTGSFSFSASTRLSVNWVYGTGNAITLPAAEYQVPEQNPAQNILLSTNTVAEYGVRNNFRIAPYHRLDIGVQFHKQLRWGERTWEISFYNFYNRKNPYYYTLATRNDHRFLQQVSFFPLIPSVSYSFKF